MSSNLIKLILSRNKTNGFKPYGQNWTNISPVNDGFKIDINMYEKYDKWEFQFTQVLNIVSWWLFVQWNSFCIQSTDKTD